MDRYGRPFGERLAPPVRGNLLRNKIVPDHAIVAPSGREQNPRRHETPSRTRTERQHLSPRDARPLQQWREKTLQHCETTHPPARRSPQDGSEAAPLQRNLALSEFSLLPPLPSTEAVLEDLQEATLQYTNCSDPTESAARRHRVLQGELNGLMAKTAASIIENAAESQNPLPEAHSVVLQHLPAGSKPIRSRGRPLKKSSSNTQAETLPPLPPLPPIPSMDEVLYELQDATLQYTSCADPVEREARIQRVRDGEVNGLTMSTAASIIAAATEKRNRVLQGSSSTGADYQSENAVLPLIGLPEPSLQNSKTTKKRGRPAKKIAASPRVFANGASRRRLLSQIQASPGRPRVSASPGLIQSSQQIDSDPQLISIVHEYLVHLRRLVRFPLMLIGIFGQTETPFLRSTEMELLWAWKSQNSSQAPSSK